MSLELLLETLEGLGLKRRDATVYAFLAKKGPQRGKDLVRALKLTKQQLYPSLNHLQEKGILKSTFKRPATYSVVPVEEALDMFIRAKIDETQRLIQNKKEALSKWKSLIRNNSES